MGKRRIRNLLFHGIPKEQIFGFDPSPERAAEVTEKYGVQTFTDLAEAEKQNPAVYVISTPPNRHLEYCLRAAEQKKHFFVEVGVDDQGYDKLASLLDNSFVAAPSCTFRYLPPVKKITELVAEEKIGKVLTFTYHLGQYLPDWHPWEDYRKVYFAQKETSACREMFVFELIWLTKVLGTQIKKVYGGFTGRISELEMTADDLSASVLGFENGVVGSMVIEVLARTPFRTLRLIGTEGVLEWEWKANQIRIFEKKTEAWETISLVEGKKEAGYVTTEDMYEEEMNVFLSALEGKAPYPYTFTEDQKIIQALRALEKPYL